MEEKLAGPEGRNSAEEDVEDDADAPDVGLRAIVPLEHLRRDVVGAADDVPEHLPCSSSSSRAKFILI